MGHGRPLDVVNEIINNDYGSSLNGLCHMCCADSLCVSIKEGPLYFSQKRGVRRCLKGSRVAGDVHPMLFGPQLDAQTRSSPLQVRGGHDHDATDLALRPGGGSRC